MKKNRVIIFYTIILMLSISNLLELSKINLMGKDESIRELFKTKYENLWESNKGINYYFDYETGNAYVIADDNNRIIIILRINNSLAAKSHPDLYPQEIKRRDEKIGINTEIEGRDFNIVFKEGYIYAQTSRISVKPLKYVIYPDKIIKIVEGEKKGKLDTEDKEILLILKNRIETFNDLLSQVKKTANSIIIIKLFTLILFFILSKMVQKRDFIKKNKGRMLG